MVDLAKVEGDEIVIRITIGGIIAGASFNGIYVTDVRSFMPCVARAMNTEGMDGELFLNKVLDAAVVRATESDAPGCEIREPSIDYTIK